MQTASDESRIWLIGFSPTRASWRVGEQVAQGMGRPYETADLTYARNDAALDAPRRDGRDHVLVVCAPVYGGHVAPAALERMAALRGGGARAVALVTYGNRAFDGALAELADFLTAHGCRVVAAGAFVGEHSYSTPRFPVAAGRPDATDLEAARQLGARVAALPPDAPVLRPDSLADTDATRGMAAFRAHIKQLMDAGATVPPAPVTDAAVCTHCGMCAGLCPTQAIEAGREEITCAERCLRCCACVKACPQGARTYVTPFSEALAAGFSLPRAPRVWV